MGLEGIHVDDHVFYRVYENNFAGKTSDANLEKISRSLRVKSKHYGALLGLNLTSEEKTLVDSELIRVNSMLHALQDERQSDDVVKQIKDKLRSDTTNYWWANY